MVEVASYFTDNPDNGISDLLSTLDKDSASFIGALISTHDSIDEKNAKKLILMQKMIEKNQKYADFIIRNDSSIKDFISRLNLVLDKLPY